MFLNQLQVRDGDIVEDAGNFLPERYLGKAKEGSGGLKNFLQYSEFGSSTRSCLGQRTAKIMLKSVIAELFTRYRVEAIPKSQKFSIDASDPSFNRIHPYPKIVLHAREQPKGPTSL
jgi:cytochrome P450